MKRGPAIGIGIGIAVVIIVAVFAALGNEPTDENSTENADQPDIQETPSEGTGEGQRFEVTLSDGINTADNP